MGVSSKIQTAGPLFLALSGVLAAAAHLAGLLGGATAPTDIIAAVQGAGKGDLAAIGLGLSAIWSVFNHHDLTQQVQAAAPAAPDPSAAPPAPPAK